MKKYLALSLVLFLVAGVVGSAMAAGYIGADKCKVCHQIQFKSWMEGKHAKAFEVLKDAEQSDAKCLKCHTTGSADNKGVQCEACHGPGSDYKTIAVMKDRNKSVAAGLVVPTEATCKGCHNPEAGAQFKGFNYAEAMKKGIHAHKPK